MAMRKRVAFLGHGYHTKTLSSRFMIDHIAKTRDVNLHFDNSWEDKSAGLDLEALVAAGYDEIHVWQLERPAQKLAALRPGCPVFFYPMFDSCRMLGDDFWLSLKDHLHIVCFCRALHERVRRLGLTSLWLQYWPAPDMTLPDYADLRIFWWRRRRDLTWDFLKELTASWPQPRLHLHEAPDPTYPNPESLPSADVIRYNVTRSTWFEDRAAFDRVAATFNVFVAPRRFEGIGFSFLEAMARGQVVVAENNPTMNEYIVHGVNGLLYEPGAAEVWAHHLTPARARDIGSRARLSCEMGQARWEEGLARLDTYVRDWGDVPAALLEPAGRAARRWLPEPA
ncbi:glycosyltransferase [Roseomonas sp. CAU 1739]|uniref:glycosyltransferase n=1 Tax=Roseomonas sp. CAU 1739 TaxID=3140364 RepID=UPI00325A540E